MGQGRTGSQGFCFSGPPSPFGAGGGPLASWPLAPPSFFFASAALAAASGAAPGAALRGSSALATPSRQVAAATTSILLTGTSDTRWRGEPNAAPDGEKAKLRRAR